MGRHYLSHMGGFRLFCCVHCETFLTNRGELISTRFTGATGRAFLFNKVVNLNYSERSERVMLTGRHWVRDVFCKKCNDKVGWMYEFALEEQQKYKEGKVILEKALVRERDGLPNDAPDAEQLAAAGTPQQQVAAAQQLQQPPTQQLNQIQFQGHQHHGHHLQQL